MSVKITAKTEAAKKKLAKLQAGLTPDAVDYVIEEAARQTQAGLVAATPKKWFGQARAGWIQPDSIIKPQAGSRIVRWNAPEGITSPIMLWLEEGTRRHGPVVAKRLFIPLTKKAALWFMAASGYTVAQHSEFRSNYKRTIVSPKTFSRIEEFETIDDAGNYQTRRKKVKRRAIEVRGSIVRDGETRAVPRTLVYGVDYVLSKQVAGIPAQHIVENFRPKSREILKNLMVAHIQKLIKS